MTTTTFGALAIGDHFKTQPSYFCYERKERRGTELGAVTVNFDRHGKLRAVRGTFEPIAPDTIVYVLESK